MHSHHDAGLRAPAGKRQRNEEWPIGGVNHVVAIAADLAVRQHDLGRQIPHRVQAAAKANHLEGQGCVVCSGSLCVIGSHHRHPRTKPRGGGCDLACVGADTSGRRGKLAGQHENVHVRCLQ